MPFFFYKKEFDIVGNLNIHLYFNNISLRKKKDKLSNII